MTKSYIQTLTEFHNIYQKEILPLLKKEEVNRKSEKKFVIYFYITLLAFLALTILSAILYSKNNIFAIIGIFSFIMFIILLACTFFVYRKNKDYQNSIKEQFLAKYLKVFGNIKWFNNTDLIPDIDIQCSGLLPTFDKTVLDDSYMGIFNGVNFTISEKTLYKKSKKHDDFTNLNNDKVFSGCFVTFQCNKSITNRTIVFDKKAKINKSIYLQLGTIICISLFLSILGIKFALAFLLICCVCIGLYSSLPNFNNLGERFEHMELEDLKFNNMYASYSTSQLEGRYLITPAFMERLLNLKLAFKAKNISASFFEDKLMIAIETDKDLFEIGDLWHPLTDIKYANDFYNEIYSILHMIEYFKLDKKTGL